MEQQNINIDDSILVDKCKTGDPEAMERLILKYQDRIYNCILKICANNDDAAELTQETFVKIIENINNFEGRSSFYTWAFRIAVNLTINHCKKNVKIGFKPLESFENEQSELAKKSLKNYLTDESYPDPAAYAQNKELCKIVIWALMNLDDAQRTVIILRDITSELDIKTIIEKLLDSAAHKFSISGNQLTVTSSLGIARFPGDGDTVNELLKHADMAMYKAKQEGKNRYCFYTPPN